MNQSPEIEYRECRTVAEMTDCVRLQREVFALPELEISPVRHFVVTLHAGGFTLGAFHQGRLIGFTLSVPAILGGEKAFYSHMTAVDKDFQSFGVGAQLKWKQREIALERGIGFIKWTFQPEMARNAFFNLEKLGAVVKEYRPNFYGTDYSTAGDQMGHPGLDSDRLFAEWHLASDKVRALSKGEKYSESGIPAQTIEIPDDWNVLVSTDIKRAITEQERIRGEFQSAFARGLIARGFKRDERNPMFLLFAG